MSLDYELTKITDWVRTCFIGLTEMPEGADLDEWANSNNGYFKPSEAENDELFKTAAQEGWILMRQDPTVEALIFAGLVMQPSGGGGITKKNLKKWQDRLVLWQELAGPIGSRFHLVPIDRGGAVNSKTHWEDYYLTKADLEKYVGLSTNCSPVTDTEFRKKLEQKLKENANRRLRQLEKEAKEAVEV